jgi:multidrug efflux pump
MTVNIMVLFGLVLTTGLLVDSAIVIVEYADRKMAEGVTRQQAYIQAAQRMFWPVFSSTATTLAAFIPMLLWPGVPGEFMSYLPIMVIVVLSASIVTAMVFLPVIGGIVGKTAAKSKEQGNAQLLSGTHKVDVNELHGITGVYARMLLRLIKMPELVILAILAIAVSVFMAFGANNAGVEFFVEEEPERAVVLVSARGNLAPAEVRDLTVEVERRLMTVPGVKHVITTAGTAPGGAQLGDVEDKPVDTVGQITIELRDYCCRRQAKDIFADIRALAAEIPGIRTEISVVQGGPPTGKDLRLEVTAQDYATVQAATARVRTFLETSMEGLRDIEDTRPLPGIEWELNVDREEAGRFGTDIAEVGAMIQLVTDGALVGTYRPDDSDDEIDIRVRLPKEERTFDQLDQLRVQTSNGMVPLANLVERAAKPKVSTITRQNGAFAMDVKANMLEGVVPDDKVRELDAWLTEQQWPASVKFRFRGADEEQKESAAFLGVAAMGALFMMFVILVTQFNSFYQTILTLATVVLAVVGVLIGMLVTGQKFSIIMTGTGVVALAGIVVNNAIVLMDTFNRHHRAGGLNTIDAVIRTASQRLRPIFLTTFTTMMGLIPMATQVSVDYFNRSIEVGGITSTWWVQLSTAIIFGLGFSTLLTLLLIPTMLALPYVYQQRWKALRTRFSKPVDAEAEAPATAPPVPANDSTPEPSTKPAAKPKRRRKKKVPGGGAVIPEAAE